MTEQEEECSVRVIEFCRTHLRKLGLEEFTGKMSLRPEDVAIAACFAAHDLATAHKANDPVAGVEFLRTAADVIERQLLNRSS